MSDSKTSSSGGIGFGGLLAIVFITLKLTHVIDWSWWWVLAPLWGSLVLILGCLVLGVAFLAVIGLVARAVAKLVSIWNRI